MRQLTLIVDVNAPRIERSYDNIEADIELESVDKKRVRDVSTDDAVFLNRNV